eukprot:c47328_g1_i1 orf=128-859(+)
MAGRISLSCAARGLSRCGAPLRSRFPSIPAFSSFGRPPVDKLGIDSGIPGVGSGLLPIGYLASFPRFHQHKWLSSDVSAMPDISDPDVKKAFNILLAVSWSEISRETEDLVEAALSKTSDNIAGQEALANAWRAAEAVEKFSGTLIALRMELDETSGFAGENVKELPDVLQDALNAALSRYKKYHAAFGDDELYLKKKVEAELGTLLIHIKQRCSGLGPEWGNIGLLGTSGLSGSYIEHFNTV